MKRCARTALVARSLCSQHLKSAAFKHMLVSAHHCTKLATMLCTQNEPELNCGMPIMGDTDQIARISKAGHDKLRT